MKKKEIKKQTSVFELNGICYGYNDDKAPQYPSFEVNSFRLGLFSHLGKAVQAMKEYIEQEKECGRHDEVFGFLIYEFELDKLNYSITKTKRNYLPDGSLLDENLLYDDGSEEFFGRPADKMRFCKGDLVEVYYGDEVRLEIVGDLPPSPEWVSERKSKYSNFRLDASDDCYYTLPVSDDVDDHSHPDTVNMFPLRFPVSDELKSKLETIYKANYPDRVENNVG
jgi:hypothetical protein